MTKVIFIRHGQTSWNKEKKYQGHSDICLNEAGLRQAELVGKRLAGEKINAIYSSDLLRACQTAECVAKHHALPIIRKPELREINFGVWEGLTYQQIMKTWPAILTTMYSQPAATCPPQGESFDRVRQRVSGALQQCIGKHPNETIVIVSHGGTMRVILCAALKIDLDKIWFIRQDSTAINIIEYLGKKVLVTLINDTCHLK